MISGEKRGCVSTKPTLAAAAVPAGHLAAPNRFGIGTPYLFPALPCPGCHRQTCKESETQSPPDPCHAGTPIRVPAWGPAARPHSPLHPLLGWLALELPRLPLLEFGGSFPGGGGSPGHPGGRLDLRFVGLQAHGCAGASSLPRVAAVPTAPVLARDGSSDLLEGRFGAWGAPAAAPSPSPTSEGPHGAFGVLPPCPETRWLSLISFLCSPWGRAPSVPLSSPQPGISPAQSPLIPLPQRQRRARRAPELVGQCTGSLPPTPGWMWHPGTPRWHHPGGCARP